MIWAEPAWFLLLLLLPLPWLRRRRRPALGWSSVRLFARVPGSGWCWFDRLAPWLEAVVLVSLATALARPRTVAGTTRVASEGVAIVVLLDRSSSMNAADFVDEHGRASSRMASAKQTAVRFVQGRPDDLIGLVAFANEPDLTCPATLDHEFVESSIRTLQTASADDDGTNLGDAIAWGADALAKTGSQRKRLVLLSDGRNAPQLSRRHKPLDPVEASEICRALGIPIDTIAIGDAGGLFRQNQPAFNLDIVQEVGGPDLQLLAEIAKRSGGVSFHARDENELAAAFRRIDALEKSAFEEKIFTRYHEHFTSWAIAGLVALTAWVGLRSSRGGILP